jgi:hypothetical protein
MRQLGWLLLLMPVSCDSRSTTRPTGAAPGTDTLLVGDASPAVEVPDRCGGYVMAIGSLPAVTGCAGDADCAWTGHRPGSCCGAMCATEFLAGDRAWVEADEALYRRVCEPTRDRWRCDCDVRKCVFLVPVRAECRAGLCSLVFE